MRDKSASIAPIAAVVGVFGLCCGLPVLLSLGVLGAIAGLSLQSWALIWLGLGLAVLGWAGWARRRRKTDPRCGVGESRPPMDRAADQTPDTSTNGISS